MKQVLNEIRRMQQLAGINLNEIKVHNPAAGLNKNDLEELKKAILSVYTDWLDMEDHADGGYVFDTEKNRWVDLYDFVLSMIYRGVEPSFLEELEEKIKFLKDDEGKEIDVRDYIEIYHDDWIEDMENSIREDIPGYFNDYDDDDDDDEDY